MRPRRPRVPPLVCSEPVLFAGVVLAAAAYAIVAIVRHNHFQTSTDLAIFDQSGFLNTLLSSLGVVDRPVMFLGYQSKLTIFIAVALAEIWRATAIMMVILVAGMGLIPKEYYEAAEVFGASPWQRFVRVTLPLLRPSLQTAIILRVILAFEVFAVVAALGGNNLPVLMGETYNWQFTLQDRNVAAASALLILAISIGFTLFFLRVLRVPKEARI